MAQLTMIRSKVVIYLPLYLRSKVASRAPVLDAIVLNDG